MEDTKTREYTGEDDEAGGYYFHKDNPANKVWDVTEADKWVTGPMLISFDKKKIYNLWTDYPDNMTKEEVEIFDEENPFWADFFSWRKEDPNWRETIRKEEG